MFLTLEDEVALEAARIREEVSKEERMMKKQKHRGVDAAKLVQRLSAQLIEVER